jgi:hypothetical protein
VNTSGDKYLCRR